HGAVGCPPAWDRAPAAQISARRDRTRRDDNGNRRFTEPVATAFGHPRHHPPRRQTRPHRNRVLRNRRSPADRYCLGPATGRARLMEIVGRWPRRTPIQEHRPITAFYRNALQIASLFFLVSFGQAGSLHAADTKSWEEFSGDKALAHVQRLVDFGPRPDGSKAIEKSRDYIEDQLRRSGWQVTRQGFSDDTPRGKIQFVNLIAQFSAREKAASPLFLLCSHYDTKMFDTIRFVGANDGGSSTGLLLELARVIGRHPNLARKIELVFFDGEEAVEQFSQADGLYGSRYFARQLQGAGAKQFRGGLLFDMVGDRSLGITLPADSPAEMARDIFAAAEALKL